MDMINTSSGDKIFQIYWQAEESDHEHFDFQSPPEPRFTIQSSFIHKHPQQPAHTQQESSGPAPLVGFYSKTWPSHCPSKNQDLSWQWYDNYSLC